MIARFLPTAFCLCLLFAQPLLADAVFDGACTAEITGPERVDTVSGELVSSYTDGLTYVLCRLPDGRHVTFIVGASPEEKVYPVDQQTVRVAQYASSQSGHDADTGSFAITSVTPDRIEGVFSLRFEDGESVQRVQGRFAGATKKGRTKHVLVDWEKVLDGKRSR